MGELREANPDFRTLVLTESMERIDFARAVEAGAADVLYKTADSYWLEETLYGIISRLCRGCVQ